VAVSTLTLARPEAAMEIKQAIMVLADISGYTRFMKLHTVSLLPPRSSSPTCWRP
jgi:hypothetical protein